MKQSITVFRLMELIIVIILVIALLIVVVPGYLRLSENSPGTSTNAIASALSASNSVNYSLRQQKNTTSGIPISNCADMANIYKGSLPKGYSIVKASIPVNVTMLCTLEGPSSTVSFFSATGIH